MIVNNIIFEKYHSLIRWLDGYIILRVQDYSYITKMIVNGDNNDLLIMIIIVMIVIVVTIIAAVMDEHGY